MEHKRTHGQQTTNILSGMKIPDNVVNIIEPWCRRKSRGGQIRDFRIYGRVISNAEILTLYNN